MSILWKLAPWLAYVLGIVLMVNTAPGNSIGLYVLFAGMVIHFRFWGKVLFLIFAFLGGALVGFKFMKD